MTPVQPVVPAAASVQPGVVPAVTPVQPVVPAAASVQPGVVPAVTPGACCDTCAALGACCNICPAWSGACCDTVTCAACGACVVLLEHLSLLLSQRLLPAHLHMKMPCLIMRVTTACRQMWKNMCQSLPKRSQIHAP